MNFKYYIYIYLNPLKVGDYVFGKHKFNYEPFYVGKGCGNRLYFHIQYTDTVNRLKQNIINKIINEKKKPIIIKLYEDISEYSAYRLERKLIQIIGRRDNKNGTLSNLTDGGEGGFGILYTYERRLAMITNKSKIMKYDTNGTVVEIFENITDLSIKYPEILTNHIHRACKSEGNRKYYNYFWKYCKDENIGDRIILNDKYKKIIQYGLNGNFIKLWDSVNELYDIGYPSGAILKCCRNNQKNMSYYKFKDYVWFFKENEFEIKIKPYSENRAFGSSRLCKKKIKMLSTNNKLIKILMPQELKIMGFLTKTIYRCCNGELNTTQGYKWEWY